MTRGHAEGPFGLDLERFPLVCLRSPSFTRYDAVDVESFFVCVDMALARRTPFVVAHDIRQMPHVNAERRRAYLRGLEPRRPELERLLVAYAAICGSPLERGMATALLWFSQLRFPTRILSSEAEAHAWLLARYDDARSARLDVAARH